MNKKVQIKNMFYNMFSYIFKQKNQQISGARNSPQSVGVNKFIIEIMIFYI